MMRQIFAVIFCVTLLTACDSYDRVNWSPDGKRVAVVASDGLRLADEAGNLSAPVLDHATICRWLPDSNHAVVVSTKETTNWNDIKELLSASERAKVSRIGERMWKSGSIYNSNSPDVLLVSDAVLYLNYKYGTKPVRARLAKILKMDAPVSETISVLQTLDLSSKNPSGGPVLWRTTESIDDVRISPMGTLAAVSVDTTGSEHKIIVLSLNGGAATTVENSLADFPDWSADGKSLFYILYPNRPEEKCLKKINDNQLQWIATINRQEIADAHGQVLPKCPAAKTLVELPIAGDSSSHVHCMADGSVVFNSKQRQFPSITKFQAQSNLFKLSPDFQHVEPMAPANELLGDKLDCFEVNQDGTKIAVPGSHGEVTVLDVASGKVDVLEKAGPDGLTFIPHWRTKDELCYPTQNREKDRAHDVDVVLQSLTEPTHRVVLSKDWPVKSVGFLKVPLEPHKMEKHNKPQHNKPQHNKPQYNKPQQNKPHLH